MKKLSAVLLVGLLLNVSQHLQAQIKVEKGKTITIEILNVSNEPPPSSSKLDIVNAPSLTACNIQVRRGSEKTDVKIDPKSNKGIYEFEGRELGQETISWEGKTKFRGFKTLRACYTNGQLSVETIESAEIREAKLAAQKKADEEERAREEARVAQKKADEEERKLGEAKLAAQKADKEAKQVKAAMDKQAKRLKELEAKLKIAEAEAAKTPEQKEKEARIAAEAKASAEAKVAAQMKEEKRKSALEEVRASRKMKVEERKIALGKIRALKEKKAKAKEEGRKREQAKLEAQNKAKVEKRKIALEKIRALKEKIAKEEEREREWKRREAQLKAEAPAKARAAREIRAKAKEEERKREQAKLEAQMKRNDERGDFQNMVACVYPYGEGMAYQLTVTLVNVAADSSYGYASMLTTGEVAKFCQQAYGKPSEENIKNAKQIAVRGNITYWVVDRGNAAVGMISRRKVN
ncbi:hypothetical protein N9K20_02910 [Methylophilaceae bacterium]|nr:hypothetical protein [Methylophilaceae bacterium]